jgi:hypothetical protein
MAALTQHRLPRTDATLVSDSLGTVQLGDTDMSRIATRNARALVFALRSAIAAIAAVLVPPFVILAIAPMLLIVAPVALIAIPFMLSAFAPEAREVQIAPRRLVALRSVRITS